MKLAQIPFKKIGQTDLGIIFRPYIEAWLFSAKRDIWVPAEMIVDTGADYTMLPKRYADFLKIDLNTECIPKTTAGVGGLETVYLYRQGLKIKIGQWEQVVPVGVLERDDIPALLGRLHCLEKIKLIFDRHVTTIEKSS